jgi:C4-dicarboxylate-specific signal transduction histidine kinase
LSPARLTTARTVATNCRTLAETAPPAEQAHLRAAADVIEGLIAGVEQARHDGAVEMRKRAAEVPAARARDHRATIAARVAGEGRRQVSKRVLDRLADRAREGEETAAEIRALPVAPADVGGERAQGLDGSEPCCSPSGRTDAHGAYIRRNDDGSFVCDFCGKAVDTFGPGLVKAGGPKP